MHRKLLLCVEVAVDNGFSLPFPMKTKDIFFALYEISLPDKQEHTVRLQSVYDTQVRLKM